MLYDKTQEPIIKIKKINIQYLIKVSAIIMASCIEMASKKIYEIALYPTKFN